MTQPKKVATAYLEAWSEKSAASLSSLVDEHIDFRGPGGWIRGRTDYIAAASRMFAMLARIDRRIVFEDGDRATLIYDFVCKAPVGVVRTAELIKVADGRIVESEIFFDTAAMTAPRAGSAQ